MWCSTERYLDQLLGKDGLTIESIIDEFYVVCSWCLTLTDFWMKHLTNQKRGLFYGETSSKLQLISKLKNYLSYVWVIHLLRNSSYWKPSISECIWNEVRLVKFWGRCCCKVPLSAKRIITARLLYGSHASISLSI